MQNDLQHLENALKEIKPIKITFSIKDRDNRDSIEKVIFSKGRTIVLWKDGEKTIVTCGDSDNFDPEKGIAMAISKKFFGNKGNYNNVFKRLIAEAKHQEHGA